MVNSTGTLYGGNNNFGFTLIQGETESILHIDQPRTGVYRCIVTDGVKSKKIDFRVQVDTGFTAEAADGEELTVAAGNTLLLQVDASVEIGELSFQWYYCDEEEGEEILIEDEDKSFYRTEIINKPEMYKCIR